MSENMCKTRWVHTCTSNLRKWLQSVNLMFMGYTGSEMFVKLSVWVMSGFILLFNNKERLQLQHLIYIGYNQLSGWCIRTQRWFIMLSLTVSDIFALYIYEIDVIKWYKYNPSDTTLYTLRLQMGVSFIISHLIWLYWYSLPPERPDARAVSEFEIWNDLPRNTAAVFYLDRESYCYVI